MHPDSTLKNPHVADKEFSWAPHLPTLSLRQFLARPFLEKLQKWCTLTAPWKTYMLLTRTCPGLHIHQHCPQCNFWPDHFGKSHKNDAPWQHHEKPTCCWQWISLGSTFSKIVPKAISGQTILGKVSKMMHPDSTMKKQHVADKEFLWAQHFPKLSLKQFLARPF